MAMLWHAYQPIHGILARETNDSFVGSKGEHSTHTEGTTAVLLASRVFSTFVACGGARLAHQLGGESEYVP